MGVEVSMECGRCHALFSFWDYHEMSESKQHRFLNGHGCPECDGSKKKKEGNECRNSE